MACEGAGERREGLIADMVELREALTPEALQFAALSKNVVLDFGDAAAVFFTGYLATMIDHLAAAVIALAGPCCEDCDE